jgi:hypothetical protein
VSGVVDGKPIYCVADAVSEIASARQYSDMYNIVPIGFGYVIGRAQVMEAVDLVREALAVCSQTFSLPFLEAEIAIDSGRLVLPDQSQVEESLQSAGARHVVTGGAAEIMSNLQRYLCPVNQDHQGRN